MMIRTKGDVTATERKTVNGYSPVVSTSKSQAQDTTPAGTSSHSHSKLLVLPDLNLPEGVTSIGSTFTIKGTLSANEHLILDGTFEGTIVVPNHDVAVSQHADVRADITANTITVLGTTVGNLNASDRVELRASAKTHGAINAPRVAINGGSKFEGSVASLTNILPGDKTPPDA